MPGMFSRRRGSVNQGNAPPPSSSAAIAASSAFLKNSASTNSLSSAAAAAALRSHTTSPEPIANIQTKRMIRRGSVSSIGSGSVMSARVGNGLTPTRPTGLDRRGSQSSMTERTFRSPSPGNTPSSRKARPVPAAADAPPVPTAGRRSASVEPPVQRVTSPTPRGGRGVSVDRTNFVTGAKRISSLPQLPELEREGSQRSVNFSRPMASPPASPTTSPMHKKASGFFTGPVHSNASPRTNAVPTRPHSSLGLSRTEVSGIQSSLRNVADKPVSKKKTVVPKEGERLAAGTMVSGPTGTAVSERPRPASAAAMRPAVSSQQNAQRNATASPGSERPRPASAAAMRPSATSQQNTPRNTTASPAPSLSATPMKKKKKAAVVGSPTSSDAEIEPPPKNPARAISPTPIPLRTPLQKKPSVVREDPEAEDNAEVQLRKNLTPRAASASRSTSMVQTSEGPAISYLAPKQPRVRSASLEVPDRHKSAHFSQAIVEPNGVRHAPPSRSISPAKSAMKHSPASSIRTSSPAAVNTSPRRPPPASDTSDTMSVASQDAAKPAKKKKSVRVSLDGEALSPGQEAPRTVQPPFASVRRPLSPAFNDDLDEVMQPRPALPSFGSVRSASSPARTQTAAPAPSQDTVKTTLPANGSVFNDDAIGAVIANDHEKKETVARSSGEPMPPEVTSVEGSGYHSDTSHYSEDDESGAVVERTEPVVASASTGASLKPIQPDIMIPDISVLPATPGIEEDGSQLLDATNDASKEYSVPGGWGEPEEYQRPSPHLEAIEESDSDNSDAFSDAAEDFNGGFASLDAIVHSPVTPVVRKERSVPDSPTPQVVPTPQTKELREAGSGDWTEATAYWSSLSKQHKEQLESQAAAAQDKAAVPVIEEPKIKKKKSKAAASPASETVVVAAPPAVPSPATRRPKSALKTTTSPAQPQPMRKSMRDSQQAPPVQASNEQPTQMRKSMRNTESPRTSGSMRASMRDGQGAGPRQRPASMTQQPPPRPASQQSFARPASISGLPAASAPVREAQSKPPNASAYMKMPKDDSDSESSFKKKRRPSTSTVDSMGRYNMRRSMRAGSVDARPQSPANAPTSSKWSIRSMSPPANPRTSMRQSLRRGSMDDVPTMRGKNSKALARDSKSPSRFSVSSFRASKPSAPAAPAPAPKTKTFRSRFNDSDDEVETPARGRTFASRFADSDDEADSPTVPQRVIENNYTPVRGIPRRPGQDDDDSTDLDDSDDDNTNKRRSASKRVSKAPAVPSQSDIDKVMEQARRNVAAQTGNSNVGLPEQTTPKKKVTLRTEPDSVDAITNGQQSPADSTLNKRRGLLGSIFGRKRTMSSSTIPRLQTTEQPIQQGVAPSMPTSPTGTPTRGRLQRRNTPQLSRHASSASVVPQAYTPAQIAAMNQKVSTPGAASQTSQNWPLPPAIPESDPSEVRPSTSDGVTLPRTLRDKPARPDGIKRSQSGIDVGSKANNDVYSEKTGKKKRFGKLRKAFGLND